MGFEDKFMSMMTMFMEESRRRDEENRRRDEENRRRYEEREERFLQLLQSIQPQTKAVTAVEGKSDLLPELMRVHAVQLWSWFWNTLFHVDGALRSCAG